MVARDHVENRKLVKDTKKQDDSLKKTTHLFSAAVCEKLNTLLHSIKTTSRNINDKSFGR